MEGLRLVSRQFRKQRLAVWAAGRGPDSYFTAMVFWLCETVSNVWQYGLPAAGPIRTSLPWCFGSARPSFDMELRRQCRKAGEWKV